MIEQLLDILHNLDKHLATFTNEHGMWVYALLFAIIFIETGLVIMPFLPGDSLLFAVGALTQREGVSLSFPGIFGTLVAASILGDTTNYHIGKFIGPRVFSKDASSGQPTLIERLLSRKHLDRANRFYHKYGGKAVILGKFVPVVRTFVPFVAGAGAMNYKKFIVFNIIAAFVWIGVCMTAGAFFGNIDWVKKNFEAVVIGIIVISVIPIAVEFLLSRRSPKASAVATGQEP